MKKLLLLVGLVLLAPSVSFAAVETIKIYSDASDAFISTQPYPESWNVQRYDTQGRFSNNNGVPSYGGEYARVFSGAFYTPTGYLSIERSFFSFDTSVIPDNAVVSSVVLNLYVNEVVDQYNDEYGYVALFRGYQSSATTLNERDIDNCGEGIDNAVFGSDKFDISDIGANAVLRIPLNVTGRDWIDDQSFTKLCLREGHDVENNETAQNDYTGTWRSSFIKYATTEVAGTDFDPYLEVTFETPEETTITREDFLETVILAISGERAIVRNFFLNRANHIFDLIEGGKNKRALLELRVFELLLRARGVNSDELNNLIQALREQLK